VTGLNALKYATPLLGYFMAVDLGHTGSHGCLHGSSTT